MKCFHTNSTIDIYLPHGSSNLPCMVCMVIHFDLIKIQTADLDLSEFHRLTTYCSAHNCHILRSDSLRYLNENLWNSFHHPSGSKPHKVRCGMSSRSAGCKVHLSFYNQSRRCLKCAYCCMHNGRRCRGSRQQPAGSRQSRPQPPRDPLARPWAPAGSHVISPAPRQI